jgi:hypothetical protein
MTKSLFRKKGFIEKQHVAKKDISCFLMKLLSQRSFLEVNPILFKKYFHQQIRAKVFK